MAASKTKKGPVGAGSGSLTFEDALDGLEAVTGRLERDDLTLDEALGCFEDGVRLMRACDAHLRDVKGKLMELVRGEDGEFITEILGDSLESFVGGMADDG